jgi:hypothetical protein
VRSGLEVEVFAGSRIGDGGQQAQCALAQGCGGGSEDDGQPGDSADDGRQGFQRLAELELAAVPALSFYKVIEGVARFPTTPTPGSDESRSAVPSDPMAKKVPSGRRNLADMTGWAGDNFTPYLWKASVRSGVLSSGCD